MTTSVSRGQRPRRRPPRFATLILSRRKSDHPRVIAMASAASEDDPLGSVPGQRHPQRRADSDLALELDGAAMQLDQAPGQRQTEAGTLEFPRQRGVSLAEWLKDLFEILAGDADTSILHREGQPAGGLAARRDLDRPA